MLDAPTVVTTCGAVTMPILPWTAVIYLAIVVPAFVAITLTFSFSHAL